MAFKRIGAEEARRLMGEEQAQIIDVRDKPSFNSGRIKGAIHVDNDTIESFVEMADTALPLIVCCYHGNMSQGAADYFNSIGFENTYSLDGGFAEWDGEKIVT